MNEWNNLDKIIKSFESYLTFRKILFNLIRPKCNETYRIHHTTGLKLLTCLRLGLSHLNDHKFNHSFRDCINPLCLCSVSIENYVYFFPTLPSLSFQGQTLMNNIKSIDEYINGLVVI